MNVDYSKLLPALFNGKDIDSYDTIEAFFDEFGDGNFVCNRLCDTFLGFIDNQEVRVHVVANRLSVEFIDGKPSEEQLNKIEMWFKGDDEMTDFVVSPWKENNHKVIIQYYWNPYV